MSEQARVLVTGGSGFIGSHCIIQLLHAGYRVRTSIRNRSREPDVQAMLRTGGIDNPEAVEFVAADLTADTGWDAAVAGCDYVLHVASPFPITEPKHEDELIRPAREGALRVLRAARDAGVKRVVLTSSFAAIGYGHPAQSAPFDERSWTNVDAPNIRAYIKSKTLAERAAWDFVEREGESLELSVVNPVGVFGPILGKDYSTSIELLRMALDGRMPLAPNLYVGVVDVRDVADLHLRCMLDPRAKGERFISMTGSAMSVLEMCKVLRRRLGKKASRAPTKELPNWLVRIGARFNPQLALLAPDTGKWRSGTGEKARALLGWPARSAEEALVATGESLIEHGLI